MTKTKTTNAVSESLKYVANSQRALRDGMVLTRSDAYERSEADKEQDEHIRLLSILVDQMASALLESNGLKALEQGEIA